MGMSAEIAREVRVSAESMDGEKEVTSWQVKTTVSGNTNVKTYNGSSCSFTMPTNATNVSVTPVIGASSIESVETTADSALSSLSDGIYTLDGKKVAAPTTPGIYVMKKGNSIRKVVKN